MYNLLPDQYLQPFQPGPVPDEPSGGGQYFLPGKFPAGDYKGTLVLDPESNKLVQDFPIILASIYEATPNDKQPVMSADQCRFCWRLSHYTRSLNNQKEEDLNKVTKSASDALAYVGLRDKNIAIGVSLWSLQNTEGSQNSADMVPPVLASIDSRAIQTGIIATDTYPNLIEINGSPKTAFDYRNQAIYTNMPEPQNSPPDPTTVTEFSACQAVLNQVWPYFDAITAGGQQVGIAASGWGCNLELLKTNKYSAMKLYDLVNNNDKEGTYNTNLSTAFAGINNNNPYIENDIDAFCKGWKLLLFRGNGFDNFNQWPDGVTGNQTYASLIGQKAYATNLRIRNINIQEKDELAFGEFATDQQPIDDAVKSWISGITEPSSGKSGGYVPTYFPIYGIPDSGWGAITEEVLSYQGIAAVIRNDYKYFCRWHRSVYYLLYLQNGGNMFNFSSEPDPDPIYTSSKPNLGGTPTPPLGSGPEPGQFPYWLPTYLKNEEANSTSWVGQGESLNKNYTLFGADAWPVDTNSNANSTLYWANRWDPYRGQGLSYQTNPNNSTRRIQWSTPAYTLGYSPVWVAAGKTDIKCNCYPYINEPSTPPGQANYNESTALESQDTNSQYARPVAECLNPYFSGEGGLYSASDGDQNLYIAYKLAQLKWTAIPDEPSLEPGSDYEGEYNCDVADFKGVSKAFAEMESISNTQNAAFNYTGSPLSDSFLPILEPSPTTSLHNIIGYGVNKDNQLLSHNGKLVTTWEYMATAIRKTLVSQNGTGWQDNYGNFATGGSLRNRRIITLGHDTGGSPIKVDYIDPRIYEIAITEPTDDPYRDQWLDIFNDNFLTIQNICGNQTIIPDPE